ncbi:MAG TPA: YibE/F family protein [Nocardioides sp.]|uniref:YibE/F family protein n=1 Tax=Nocardioides sp. TaxID=35761 RepID=UPI002F4099EE
MILLWPDGTKLAAIRQHTPFAAPGVTTTTARVTRVAPACKGADQAGESAGGCGTIEVRVLAGAGAGDRAEVRIAPEVTASGIGAGDVVQLVRTPAQHGQPASYTYDTTRRTSSLLWLTVGFVLVVLAVARLRGMMALIGLGFGALTIYYFLVPALLVGEPPILVAVVAASAIMFVVLYTTHGPSLRTSTALAGTLVGIVLTAALSVLSVGYTHLTGIADETGGMVSTFAAGLDFQGLLVCGVILAGLGVLNDVTITQASSVWELRAASASGTQMSRRRLFVSAMRIGRDHIASTIYTIAFAYAGASLAVLLLLTIYDRPLIQLISSESLAEEIARTLVTATGLILAVPVTTAIATLVASAAPDQATSPLESRPE